MRNHRLNINSLSLTREKRYIERKRLLFIWLLLILPLAHFVIFTLYSNIHSLVLSFQTETGNWTTINYQNFLKDIFVNKSVGGYVYLKAIAYSFLMGINDVVLVLISTVLAYFIFKKIPGRQLFRVVYFLPSIIAMTIYVLLFKFLLNSFLFPLSKYLNKFLNFPSSSSFI